MSEYQNNEWNNNYEHGQQGNGSAASESSRKKKKKGAAAPLKAIAIALSCALIGGVVGAGAAISVQTAGSSSVNTTTIHTSAGTSTEVSVELVSSGEEKTAAEVYAENVNATVGITTSITTNYFGYESTSAASGSRFIITSDGYVLTCYHVVEDSDTITVTTYDDTSYDAELIGYDESNDIAVLKIEATDLQTVVVGDSDALNVGDGVVAIGNPLGELTFSLTYGVVSALNRSVTLSTNVTMELIQTDCAINSGNSGGALFNMYGEVIGIVNAKYSSSSSSSASIDNIGFAIPISNVIDIVTSIIETGNIESPYIGVSITDMTTTAAASTGLTEGAVVVSVTEGSPAEEAGIQASDVITKVDDTEITGSSDLVTAISKTSGGDEIVLTINRSGETMEMTVTVGIQTESALPETETENSADDSLPGQDNSGSNGSSTNPFGNNGQNTNPFNDRDSQSDGSSSGNPL